jgi:transcriptional regulator with XRE-family HTH domain
MNTFSDNKIFQESDLLTEKLRSARGNTKFSIEQIAKRIKIKPAYLYALEQGNFSALPNGVYAKKYLSDYATFLGLDRNETVELFSELYSPPADEKQKLFSNQVVKKYHFWTIPRFIKNTIISFLAIACFVYLGFRLENIITPPNLIIFTPIDNLITQTKNLEITGQTEPEAEIYINNEKILSNSEGKFSKNISLKNGINIITINAQKKYGSNNTVTKQVFVE